VTGRRSFAAPFGVAAPAAEETSGAAAATRRRRRDRGDIGDGVWDFL
jgi:hypothetical protein